MTDAPEIFKIDIYPRSVKVADQAALRLSLSRLSNCADLLPMFDMLHPLAQKYTVTAKPENITALQLIQTFQTEFSIALQPPVSEQAPAA